MSECGNNSQVVAKYIVIDRITRHDIFLICPGDKIFVSAAFRTKWAVFVVFTPLYRSFTVWALDLAGFVSAHFKLRLLHWYLFSRL